MTPHATAIAIWTLFSATLTLWSWRQWRTGGRGQRPLHDRAMALGALLVFGGMVLAPAALLLRLPGGPMLAAVPIAIGMVTISCAGPVFRTLDRHRSNTIRRQLGLDGP